jgi:hypothetical protein
VREVSAHHWRLDGGITAAKGWCPRSFHNCEEEKMIAQWIGTAGVMVGLALLHWADRMRR